MLRSNTKKVIERIRSYVLENAMDYECEQFEDFKAASVYIGNAFYNEKMKYNNRRINRQDLFVEWLSGLPSVLDPTYYYKESAIDLLGDMLEETEEEKSRYEEMEAEILLSKLIYREISKFWEV